MGKDKYDNGPSVCVSRRSRNGWVRRSSGNDRQRDSVTARVTSFWTSSLVGFLLGVELMWTGLGWLWPSSGTPYTDWRRQMETCQALFFVLLCCIFEAKRLEKS